jgi:hypothetical protein
MSYIRPGTPYIYVEGETDDYIFLTDSLGKKYVEDFDKLSKKTIIDLIYRNWDAKGDQKVLKEYLLQNLAIMLKVKLRPKPLTKTKYIKECKKLMEENYKEILKFQKGE